MRDLVMVAVMIAAILLLAAYVAFVIALALLVSIWLARRVSKRVLALVEEVGAATASKRRRT